MRHESQQFVLDLQVTHNQQMRRIAYSRINPPSGSWTKQTNFDHLGAFLFVKSSRLAEILRRLITSSSK